MAQEGKPATGPSSPRSSPSSSPSNILPTILPTPPPPQRPLKLLPHHRRPHHPNPPPIPEPCFPMSLSQPAEAMLSREGGPFSIFHFRRKSNASPTSTRLARNSFLSPTYAKTGGYPLPENVGAPTFSIFPLIFYSFSPDLQNEATARAIKECWHKSQRYRAACGERSGPPPFPREAEVSAGPPW